MAKVTLDLIYQEIRLMRKELRKLRQYLVRLKKISK